MTIYVKHTVDARLFIKTFGFEFYERFRFGTSYLIFSFCESEHSESDKLKIADFIQKHELKFYTLDGDELMLF